MIRLLTFFFFVLAAPGARAADGGAFEEQLRAVISVIQAGRSARYILDRSANPPALKPAQPASTLSCATDARWSFLFMPQSSTPLLETPLDHEGLSFDKNVFTIDLERLNWLARLGPDGRQAFVARAWEDGPRLDVVVRLIHIPYPYTDEVVQVFVGQLNEAGRALTIAERSARAWTASSPAAYSVSGQAQIYADQGAALVFPLASGQQGLDRFTLDCRLR